MNFGMRRVACASIVLGVMPVLALAEEASTAARDDVLEEIVVTAQKRQESLRDVPLSVAAVSGDKLQDAGIVRLDDLAAYVPSLKMSETGIANNIYIRGIGSGLNQGFEQSVSLYQDGVYHGRGHQSRMPFLDLARIEVLRGPQPILFGKNAVAGAVNLIANQPTPAFEATARLSRDFEHDETIADGAISGPFSDSVRGRLAGFYRKSDGYMDNATLGTNEPRHDDIGARLIVAADISPSLTASLRAEMGNFDTDGRQVEILGETPVTAAGLPWTGATYTQALNSLTGGTIPGLLNNKLDYVRSATDENFSNNRFRETALTLDYALPGDLNLTSVSAFSNYRLNEGCDCDFVAAPLLTAGIGEDYKQYSQELRLASSTAQRLQWIGGLYFQRYTLDEHDFLHLPVAAEEGDLPVPMGSLVPTLVSQDPTARNGVAGALTQAGQPACSAGPSSSSCQQAAAAYIRNLFTGASNPRDFSQDSTMYSAFLQGTWQFNDKWDGTLGARISHEKKDGRRHAWMTDANGNLIPGYDPATPATYLSNGLFNSVLGIIQHDIRGSRSETNVAPLLNLQYHATPLSMAYLSVSRGYKSGGFDARSNKPTQLPPGVTGSTGTFEYADERATTFEVGIKTATNNGRAEASVAAFHTDYKNLQTSAFDGRIGFNVGNGSAEVRGAEAEGRWRPVGALTLKASMALLDFRWSKYDGQCYYDLAVATGGLGNAVDGQGHPIPGNCDYTNRNNQFAPHFSGVLSADYVVHLGSLAVTSTLDATHSSSYLESLNLDPVLTQKEYTKLNARIGFGDQYDRWQVAVVGRNLTDKTTVGYAADAPLAQALFKARSYYGFVDPPRSVALELRVRF